jgi:hypothetical protein
MAKEALLAIAAAVLLAALLSHCGMVYWGGGWEATAWKIRIGWRRGPRNRYALLCGAYMYHMWYKEVYERRDSQRFSFFIFYMWL